MEPTKLQRKLGQINGRRRTRLLDLGDIAGTARSLKPGQHALLHGGHVANAYKYPAFATGAAVWKPVGKRTAYVIVKTVSASAGHSGFGRESQWVPAPDDSDAIAITRQDMAVLQISPKR
jgi:hypothetical protein